MSPQTTSEMIEADTSATIVRLRSCGASDEGITAAFDLSFIICEVMTSAAGANP